jgi:hypothetical protein
MCLQVLCEMEAKEAGRRRCQNEYGDGSTMSTISISHLLSNHPILWTALASEHSNERENAQITESYMADLGEV